MRIERENGMERSSIISELKKISIAERILIVEELWDSIVADQEDVTLTRQQRDELDRRLAEYDASPDSGITWDEVKSRIKSLK